MIIFLHGSDSYRRRKKLKEIIKEYKQKHSGLAFEQFDFSGNNIKEKFLRFQEFALNYSIFENMKLAVLENIFSSDLFEEKKKLKNFRDFLKLNLEDKDLTIVFSEEKSPKKDFDFLLKKPVLAQEFKSLEGAQFEFFINQEAKNRGLNFNDRVVRFLAEVFRGDSWAMINELEKLSLLKSEFLEIGKLKEIVDYYQPLSQPKFFYAVNGILRDSLTSQKLINLEVLLSFQEDPAKIFNFLASLASAPLIIKKFADYDIAIKSGKMDYEEALVDFALE